MNEVVQKDCVTLKSLQSHKLSHTEERPFECSECGNKFKTKGGLNKHMKMEVTGL